MRYELSITIALESSQSQDRVAKQFKSPKNSFPVFRLKYATWALRREKRSGHLNPNLPDRYPVDSWLHATKVDVCGDPAEGCNRHTAMRPQSGPQDQDATTAAVAL
jgi:hypothetical protein